MLGFAIEEEVAVDLLAGQAVGRLRFEPEQFEQFIEQIVAKAAGGVISHS